MNASDLASSSRRLSPTEGEALIGIEAAASFLSVKVSWLYEQVRLGRVPSYRVGKFRRFRVSELEAWLKDRHDGPPVPVAGGQGQGGETTDG